MLETFLKLLQDLPDWEVYREVAAALREAGDLLAWRHLYESRPERDVLLREGARALTLEAERRFPELVVDPNDVRRLARPAGQTRAGPSAP
jgi:hypothetical protein